MDKKTYLRARQEFDLAGAKLKGMKDSSNLAAFAQSWSDFLSHVQRAFTRMKIATAKGPSKGWYDTIESQRHTDELLSYIRHARNADEHGVDPVTVQKPGGIGIKPKVGNSLIVDNLEIGGGKIVMGPEMAKNAKIEFIPASIHLSAVRDRGIEYLPPKSHLGVALQETTPIIVAEAAHKFVEGVLSHAEDKFG
jgi:hypothetical protein